MLHAVRVRARMDGRAGLLWLAALVLAAILAYAEVATREPEVTAEQSPATNQPPSHEVDFQVVEQ